MRKIALYSFVLVGRCYFSLEFRCES